MRLFTYKVARDYGFAPNPFHGACTLATCKPDIRRAADVGDLVIGCGTASRLPNRAIFAMLVDEKISFQQYWDSPRYQLKKPDFHHNRERGFGDNIYRVDGSGGWIQADSHHSFEGGGQNLDNIARDTSVDAVLISYNYIYWGGGAINLPDVLVDDYPQVRNYRSEYPLPVVDEVYRWFKSFSEIRGHVGRPADWDAI